MLAKHVLNLLLNSYPPEMLCKHQFRHQINITKPFLHKFSLNINKVVWNNFQENFKVSFENCCCF